MVKHKCKADGTMIASPKSDKSGRVIGATVTVFCKECGLPVKTKVMKD